MVTYRDYSERIFQAILRVQLQRSDQTVVRPSCRPNVQVDIQIGSTLHVRRRDEGIVRHCRLVCLTIQHVHQSVQCEEASTCSAKVFFGHAFHVGSSISYLSKINN